MSLFSGLGLTGPPPKPFENVTLQNDKAICLSHQEDLNLLYLSKELFAKKNNFTACSKCEKPAEMTSSCLAAFRAYSKSQCCVISPFLSQDSSERAPTVKNPDLDFSQHVTEHVLWDMNSNGYALKSLVYMKDQGILAACSKNGSISFWSIGEKVELIEPKLNLQRTINLAKYCIISDNKKYLAIGTDKGVRIYHMAGGISSLKLLGVIDEEKIVSDFDFFENEGKIVTVYNKSMAKIWNLETLEMEKVVDLNQHGIKGEIYTVMYLERTGELAVEHEKGLSVIKDWQHKDGNVRHHFVDEKKSFGCKYLSNSRVFMMNNDSFVETLQEEDLEVVEINSTPKSLSIPKKFLASQDESVIITNGALSQLQSFKNQKLQKHHLNNFVFGMSDLELMDDQYRIAVVHPHKGTVTIFRVNANMNIERSIGLSPLPAVSSTEKQFNENPTGLLPGKTSNGDNGNNGSLFKENGSGGGLLSGEGSGGSLFSGITQSGSLFSGVAKGGGLFSGISGGGLFTGGGSGGSLFSGTPSGGLLSGGGSGGSLFPGKPSGGDMSSGSLSDGCLFSGIAKGGSVFSGTPSGQLSGGVSGGSLPSGASTGANLFARNSSSNLRNPSSRVNVNNTGLFSGKSSKKSTRVKPKQASKPAKKGKKIQKAQLRSNTLKKKEKSSPSSSVKKENKKITKTESLKKQKKNEQSKNMIEAVRIRGKKKMKEEKVWVMLPSTDADDGKKRGRSLKKTPKIQENETHKKGTRKTDLSKDKGSRSRSKSKSVTRKK